MEMQSIRPRHTQSYQPNRPSRLGNPYHGPAPSPSSSFKGLEKYRIAQSFSRRGLEPQSHHHSLLSPKRLILAIETISLVLCKLARQASSVFPLKKKRKNYVQSWFRICYFILRLLLGIAQHVIR